MRCAIMQPTFLPWAGYFNLMAQVDTFVFLDDVQLAKQSWQTRNRLMIGGAPHWFGTNIRAESLSQTIAETELVNVARWRIKARRTFEQNYGRHPYLADANEIINSALSYEAANLADLNEHVITFIAGRLGIGPSVFRSRDLCPGGTRTRRLMTICEILGAAEYVSPVGSAEYLAEDGFEEQAAAILRFQDYDPGPYPQNGASKSFESHLSIVDVVANLGWARSRDYVYEGRVK